MVASFILTACVAETPAPAERPVASTTPAPEATRALPSPTPEPSGRVRLNAVGDLMLERRIITLMDEQGSLYPFEAVLHLLEDSDITIGNLEGTFTERGVRADKFYAFRTPPRHAQGLAEAGFDVVSLGNNHAMDYGVEGLEDTLEALDGIGVLHSGAGLDAQSARAPAYLERNGLRLAFLSYNAAALSEAFPAGPDRPGVALAEAQSIREDVAAALEGADLVIVSLHAGGEYVDVPTPQQRELSQAAIEAGAALVLGHHAHVFQGWQVYGDGVIVWGLGNFVFDLDWEDYETIPGPRAFLTAILHIELTRDGVESVTAYPVFIDPTQNRPVPAEGERLTEIEARIERLNGPLN